MILLLAGLQAMPKEIVEAAKVDGAGPWQGFWKITFPLMLPVSITAIVLRIIFKLKLADIVITTTSGGPGGATDTVSSFIYREYRDRSNVGYGTMLADGLPDPDHRVRHRRCSSKLVSSTHAEDDLRRRLASIAATSTGQPVGTARRPRHAALDLARRHLRQR